ncbi:hypothetical protein NDN08_002967 [Rhodosorus marinus]|uniref:EF-hand domain-containing protein n=1 Tax=Rhodosorus marinus TaxID=101924 RepID=A0AAV8UWP0_9RHOD|nr:hypothetical protein NDN08_002967 [Rhodosorus marinus]
MELFKSGAELDEDELEEIRDACELFETEEGNIPVKELKNILLALGGKVSKETKRQKLAELATQKRKIINSKDVEDIVLRQKGQEELDKKIRLVFSDICGDGEAGITLHNLKRVHVEIGLDYSEKELEAMINDVDLDGDGAVTLDDFKYALGSTDGQD